MKTTQATGTRQRVPGLHLTLAVRMKCPHLNIKRGHFLMCSILHMRTFITPEEHRASCTNDTLS